MAITVKSPRLHLVSGICFALASLVFLMLGLQAIDSQQIARFFASGLFALNAFLQFFFASKKKHEAEAQ